MVYHDALLASDPRAPKESGVGVASPETKPPKDRHSRC